MTDLNKERLSFLRRRFENASDPDSNAEDKDLFLTAMLKSGEEFLDLCEQALDVEYVLTAVDIVTFTESGSCHVDYRFRPRNSFEKPDGDAINIEMADEELIAEDHGYGADECRIVLGEAWAEVIGGDERHQQQIVVRHTVTIDIPGEDLFDAVYEDTFTLEGTKLDEGTGWSLISGDDDDDEYDEDEYEDEEEEEEEGDE